MFSQDIRGDEGRAVEPEDVIINPMDNIDDMSLQELRQRIELLFRLHHHLTPAGLPARHPPQQPSSALLPFFVNQKVL